MRNADMCHTARPEERLLAGKSTVDELIDKVSTYEACLSGTAATLTPVGALVYKGEEIKVRDGQPGPNRAKLQKALQDIQYGLATDTHGWLTEVG